MYLELDGDEVAVTYIKDVVFNANRAGVDTLRMTKVFAALASCPLVQIAWGGGSRVCVAAAVCDGQVDHRGAPQPAGGLHRQL